MLREKIRRISTLVLAVALAVGLGAHGMAGPDTGLKPVMAVAATDMPMSGKCDGCGDDQKGMSAACTAYCSSVIALPVAAVVIDVVAVDVLRPSVGPAAAGYVTPPDPYPPRPIGMS